MGRQKYATVFKLEIIDAISKGGTTIAEASKLYSIDSSTIRKWATVYKQSGVEGVERQYNSYTPEFKQQVVEDMRNNQLSYRATAIKYNIGMHTTIKQWERIYLEKGYEALKETKRGLPGEPKIGRPPSKTVSKKDYKNKEAYKTLVTENKHLKMEIEYLKKLNALIHSKGK